MVDENPIRTTVDELKKLLNVKDFIGDPIVTDDKILIPFLKWGLGFGAGKGNGPEDTGGFGSGAAAGIEPISIVVIDKKTEGMEGVRVLNLSNGTETSKAISELGVVVSDLIKELAANHKGHMGGFKGSKDSKNEKSNVNDAE
ncbi:sporulation protein [Methanobrevibacter sp. TMH8]|uniref:GerW family sporulation protein n=1 Tax=Methanobrevibacter sp. TMH8 TaxID=2848611 RepID=UPI001CCFCF16|nr:spore germination protein GerW family protein [Methanobrevibacter sp. TMH8]MBZ9570789.1 sporulation protein [Methanobrevibacter sp. TMH8]